MRLKQNIKYIIGRVQCKRFSIFLDKGKQVYIGKGVKVIGGKKITLEHDVCIRPAVDLWCGGEKIAIGAGTEIGERTRISIANNLIIGEDVLISPNVYITDCDHEYRNAGVPISKQGIVKQKNSVVIKKHAYIGINSVIVGNVTIGKGSVIGANSVVTKDIPDYCVAVGTPAKVIKKYNAMTNEWEKI